MNIRQYRDFHKGENEWLSEPPINPSDEDLKAWEQEWGQIEQDNKNAGFGDIKVEFTEDFYITTDYDKPEYVNVTIHDSGVLPLKMARGIIKSGAIEGLRLMEFTRHFEIYVDPDWGGWSYARLQIYEGGASITFFAKHSSEEVEVNITEQFNQAIGE